MFTEEDLELFLAYQAELDDLCRGCGRSRSETHDPEVHDAYEGVAEYCFACAARDRVRRQAEVDAKDRPQRMDGLYFYTARLPDEGSDP